MAAQSERKDLKIVIFGAEQTGKTALVKKVSLPPHFRIVRWVSEHTPV